MTFGDVGSFETFLTETFENYEKGAKTIERLPLLDEFALALNVASCDSLPLIVLNAKSERDLEKLKAKIAKLSWGKDFIGKQHYFAFVGDKLPLASGEDESESEEQRNEVFELEIEYGMTILEPGPFGQTAKVLGHESPKASSQVLSRAIAKSLGIHDPDKKLRKDHVRDGKRLGIEWETELPVTDSKSKRKNS